MKEMKKAVVTRRDYENGGSFVKLGVYASKSCNCRDLPCGKNTR